MQTTRVQTAETLARRLRAVGLRPTRQRMALARLLFGDGNRHVSAEQLHDEAMAAEVRVSLATVYNTLNQFTEVGLLRHVHIDAGSAVFDTNVTPHHHFLNLDTGVLTDVPVEAVPVGRLPTPPDGTTVDRVDVVIHIRETTE